MYPKIRSLLFLAMTQPSLHMCCIEHRAVPINAYMHVSIVLSASNFLSKSIGFDQREYAPIPLANGPYKQQWSLELPEEPKQGTIQTGEHTMAKL